MTRRRAGRSVLACTLAATATLMAAGAAHASITPVTNDGPGADAFAQEVFANAGILGAAGFQTAPSGRSTATATGLGSVFPTRGDGFGIISSGLAASADDPNSNDPDDEFYAADKSTGFSGFVVRGTSDYDVTVLRIPFVAPASANCLTMDFQFLSEEYAEYVGQEFNDAFIAELDTTTWDTVGTSQITAPGNFAFDSDGDVVSVNAVGIGGFSRANAAGTTYDGATSLLRASKQLTPGVHTLFLSIFDQGDNILDSAAFVDNVRVGFVANPAQNCVAGAQVANFALDVTPAAATRSTGTAHTVTAKLTDDGGAPLAGKLLAFTAAGANAAAGTATTGPDGVATFTYTGTKAGIDAISAVYDADGNGTGEAADSAAVEWVSRFALDAEPETATRSVGQLHTVTATLTNDGAAVAGETVDFVVTGANAQTGSATTDSNGVASFTYTGTALGVDAIEATYNLAGGDDGDEASDEVSAEFVNSPPDCSTAVPSVTELKQNDHGFNAVTIAGISDADGDTVTTRITTVEQDEVLNGVADGNTDVDARRTTSDDTVELRAERSGLGDGRVYVITFEGDDGRGGTCTGSATVGVPHDQRGATAVDSGERHNSFG